MLLMEYVIEISKPQATEMVSLSKGKTVTTTRSIEFASKFKARARAEKIALGIQNAQVVPYFGGVVTSNKSNVPAPQADKIRRN